MRKTLKERFWEKVNTYGPEPNVYTYMHYPEISQTRCWLWTGALNEKGRGSIKIDGKEQKVHRVAWFLATGLWPSKNVLHMCKLLTFI
jgi:hypothetical protein